MKTFNLKTLLGGLNASSVAKRLGLGALVSTGTAVTQTLTTGHAPHTAAQIALTLATGVLAMIPAGAAPAGLLTPSAPGQPALLPSLVSALKALVALPRAQRDTILIAVATAAGKAAARVAVQEIVNRTAMEGLSRDQMAPVPPALAATFARAGLSDPAGAAASAKAAIAEEARAALTDALAPAGGDAPLAGLTHQALLHVLGRDAEDDHSHDLARMEAEGAPPAS